MGFYTTASECECREQMPPPSKNRVWNFSTSSPLNARQSASQVLDLHREKRPTPTIIVSGVRYYGYRYLHPELGRWMSRDPIGEAAFLSRFMAKVPPAERPYYMHLSRRPMYLFLENGPVTQYDFLGLKCCASDEQVDEAGIAGSRYASSKTAGDKGLNGEARMREYCGFICCDGKDVYAMPGGFGLDPEWATRNGIWYVRIAKCYPHLVSSCGGAEKVGYYHSHPNESDFSDNDKKYCSKGQPYAYVGLPSGGVIRYDCRTGETLFIE